VRKDGRKIKHLKRRQKREGSKEGGGGRKEYKATFYKEDGERKTEGRKGGNAEGTMPHAHTHGRTDAHTEGIYLAATAWDYCTAIAPENTYICIYQQRKDIKEGYKGRVQNVM
jgi:hypothetical protein